MIIITLGNGAELRIDEYNHLLMVQTADSGRLITDEIDLGLATKLRIEQIQDYLGRLYVHAVEEKADA